MITSRVIVEKLTSLQERSPKATTVNQCNRFVILLQVTPARKLCSIKKQAYQDKYQSRQKMILKEKTKNVLLKYNQICETVQHHTG